jgi:hypothetical protein
MLPCTACHRHVRPAATTCPFCSAALSSTPALSCAPALLLGLAMLAACGGKEDSDTDSTTSSTSSSSTDNTTTAIPTTSSPTDATTGCATACTDASEGSGFIYGAPDAGGSPLECDVQKEDCPAGQKCMPWVNDGGSKWNALKCVPVDADPVPVGEACEAPGGGLTGIDNCDKHVMCFEVSGTTGVCRAMCESSTCEPGFNCFIANEDILQLCLPACDFNMPDCPPGSTCLPVLEGGVCAPGG